MKQVMAVTVQIELSGDSQGAIDAAAMEAQSHLKCDIAFYDKALGAYGAKLVEKKIEPADEVKLLDLVLETTGITEGEFINDGLNDSAHARHLFGYYARKYLEWSWSKIGNAVGRDRSTVIKGVQGLVGLIAGTPGKVKKQETYLSIRNQRALKAREDMERIQRKWSELKR